MNNSERPVDALAVKNVNYSLSDNLKSRDASASKNRQYGNSQKTTHWPILFSFQPKASSHVMNPYINHESKLLISADSLKK